MAIDGARLGGPAAGMPPGQARGNVQPTNRAVGWSNDRFGASQAYLARGGGVSAGGQVTLASVAASLGLGSFYNAYIWPAWEAVVSFFSSVNSTFSAATPVLSAPPAIPAQAAPPQLPPATAPGLTNSVATPPPVAALPPVPPPPAPPLPTLDSSSVPNVSSQAARPTPSSTPPAATPPGSVRNSWLGNTFNAAPNAVPFNAEALYVAPSGDVFSATYWDEGGGELTHYKDGQVLGVGGNGHGWGNHGGDAVTSDGKYVFVANAIDTEGGSHSGPGYPTSGKMWYGITRRLASEITRGAPFADGKGNLGNAVANSMKVINDVPEGQDAAIRGLAVGGGKLFAADPAHNQVHILDPETMAETGNWNAEQPGKLAADARGNVFVITRFDQPGQRQVVRYDSNGQQATPVNLPAGTDPVDVVVDSHGNLYVADNSPNQQVLKFDPQGNLLQTFGARGGILSGRAGEVGPGKFNGISSIGVDAQDNLYVAQNGFGPRRIGSTNCARGLTLESYSPTGERKWDLNGLEFVDGADADPADPTSIYTGTHHYRLDLSKTTPGSEWTLIGDTGDKVNHPLDAMFHDPDGRGEPMMRRIQGKLFMFNTDMFSNYFKVFKFNDANEIATPAALFAKNHTDALGIPNQPSTGEWIWRNAAGKDQFSADEYATPGTGQNAPLSRSWWVDTPGNVWEASFQSGIRRFEMQGLDAQGNPVYDFQHVLSYPMPKEFNQIARFQYFSEDDSAVIGGYDPAHPYDDRNWNGGGAILARYDAFTSGPKLRWKLDLDTMFGPDHKIEGYAVAGDYVFVQECLAPITHVIDLNTGKEVQTIKPDQATIGQPGWVDVPQGIRATKLANGDYNILIEDDLHARTVLYRWHPNA